MKTAEEQMHIESEKYGFRVPYDGSNNFYDNDAIKHFENGWKAMEAYASQSKWISVKDRLPEDEITDRSTSENVLALCMGKIEVMCRSFFPDGDGGYVWCNCYGDIHGDGEYDDDYGVTHWMPLNVPQPPKQ